LDQAANDDNSSDEALAFALEHLADDLEGFLLGGVDEAAGVDQDGIYLLGVGVELEALLEEAGEEAFAIDGVFGAAE
jgi:hypothetical protein